jgi:glucose/mannose-6-phosphate isomerase
MLDDLNIIRQRDPNSALTIASLQYEQVHFRAQVRESDHDNRHIDNIVLAGMGGSALAVQMLKVWLKPELNIPLEIVRSYTLPNYVNRHTLVIASSYSGNTEETLSCLDQAMSLGSQIGIISSGGQLIDIAMRNKIAHVPLPIKLPARMSLIYQLRALISLLSNFGVVDKSKMSEISSTFDWLHEESLKWAPNVPTHNNYAKKLAMQAVGKTAIFYGGELTASLAYKWKISWNENAKNIAFWNELPEFNHNEFIGWTSHPIEKPFAVFDIISDLENPQILKRFKVSDKLLSGKRPKSIEINLAGDSLIKQLLWGSILADFTSIYLAILNNVNPTPVPLIEKLKQELIN